MTIKELLQMPAGTKTGDFILTIKTAKKCWKVGEINWQSLLFMDGTGEILADVNLGKRYIPFHQSAQVQIVSAEIQLTDQPNNNKIGLSATRHKLVVDKCSGIAPVQSVWQEDDAESWAAMREEEIAGKIRHGLTIAWIQSCKRLTITDAEKTMINNLVEFVKHG